MFTTLLTGVLLTTTVVQQTDTVLPIRPGSRLEIESFGGQVVVRTWSRNELRVVADHSSRTRIAVRQWGGAVRIDAESYRGPSSVDYEITVPKDIDLDIGGTFVSVDVDGVEGEVRASTTQGDVVVRGGRDYVSLRSTQGNVELVGASGNLTLQSVTGSVSATRCEGGIEAETTSGNVILEDIQSGDVRAVTTSGRVHFAGPIRDSGRYFLSSHSGNVILEVPAEFNATVTVSTFSGQLDSDFPITLTGTTGRGRRISFTMGSGSARLDLESFSGDVQIRQRRAR